MGKEKLRALVVESPCGDLYAQLVDLGECYYVPTDHSMGAVAGDIVLVCVKSATKKNDVGHKTLGGSVVTKYAVVDTIVEYGNYYYSGVCTETEDEFMFRPDDKSMPEYSVFKTKRGGAEDLERVVARISRKKFSKEFKAGVEKIYGSSEDITPFIEATQDCINLNLGWADDNVISESDLLADSSKKRKDLRTKVAVALCDENCFCDHAYSMERSGDDIVLYFHLLDVDDLIPSGSKADTLLNDRLRFPEGYLAKKPLLPERICSSLEFKEGVDRNAVTVTAIYSKDIELKALYIDETVINLTMRLAHGEVDAALKESDTSKLGGLLGRVAVVREIAGLMFSFAGEFIATTANRGGFVGTCLAPSFTVERGRVVELIEKALYDGELLEKCLLGAISRAIGEAAHKDGFPVIYEGDWDVTDYDWARFTSYCRGPVTPDNIGLALTSLYNNCERGVYERSAYNEIYSRLSEMTISDKPIANTLRGSELCAVVDGPLCSYLGLVMLRLLKSVANKREVDKNLLQSIVLKYKSVMPLVFKSSRSLHKKTMLAYTTSLPTPAEAIVTSFSEKGISVSLVNGCVGYIYENGGSVKIDHGAKSFAVGNRTYTYGDYVTVRLRGVGESDDVAIFEPIF